MYIYIHYMDIDCVKGLGKKGRAHFTEVGGVGRGGIGETDDDVKFSFTQPWSW